MPSSTLLQSRKRGPVVKIRQPPSHDHPYRSRLAMVEMLLVTLIISNGSWPRFGCVSNGRSVQRRSLSSAWDGAVGHVNNRSLFQGTDKPSQSTRSLTSCLRNHITGNDVPGAQALALDLVPAVQHANDVYFSGIRSIT